MYCRSLLLAILAILAVACASEVALAASPTTVHGRYFSAPNYVGVYWQVGVVPDTLLIEESIVRHVEKAWTKCQQQFNEHQLSGGDRCIVTIEVRRAKGTPIMEAFEQEDAMHDLRVVMNALFYEGAVVPLEDLVFFWKDNDPASKTIGPAELTRAYLSGGEGVYDSGLFISIAKKKDPPGK